MKVWTFLVVFFVVLSDPYSKTDFTFELKIPIFKFGLLFPGSLYVFELVNGYSYHANLCFDFCHHEYLQCYSGM